MDNPEVDLVAKVNLLEEGDSPAYNVFIAYNSCNVSQSTFLMSAKKARPGSISYKGKNILNSWSPLDARES